MKILQINKFHYLKGGSETYYFALSQKLQEEGHEVIHFSMQHEQNFSSPTSHYFISEINYADTSLFTRIKNACKILWNQEAYMKLTRLLKEEKPDIAHIHNFSHQLSMSILFALKKYGIPVVMTTHDYKIVSPNYTLYAEGGICEYGKQFWKYLFCAFKPSIWQRLLLVFESYFTHWLKLYISHVQHYIAPSLFMKNKLIQSGIPEKQVSHIYNFYEVETVNTPVADHHYVLYAARLSQEKGIFTLLHACSYIPDIPVYIVGDGPAMEEAKELAAEKRLENVIFFGYVQKKDLADLYAHASCVVVPSQWYENNPYTIIEAFSYAKPVIATTMGGIPELVQNSKTGMTFKAQDAKELARCMQQMMSDEQKRKEMGLQAKIFAQQTFDATYHVAQILTIYQNVIHSFLTIRGGREICQKKRKSSQKKYM